MYLVLRVAPTAAAFLFVATATATAQTVHVVDGLNRPGANFTDLPAAIAAAQDGDTILLRNDGGFYHGATTSKALTITGDSPGLATIAGAGANMTITGLPAGRDFVLQNVEFLLGGQPGTPLVVQGCAGRVHLVRVNVSAIAGTPALDVSQCSAVTVRNGDFQGNPGLRAQNATIAISTSRCMGRGGSVGLLPGTGAELTDCHVWFADVQTYGGNAFQTNAPASAIELVDSDLSFTGVANAARAQSGFLGSSATPGFTAAVPAIHGQNSTLRVDPKVVLSPTGGASAIVGPTTTTTAIPSFTLLGVPLLQSQSDPAGATATATLVGLPANPLPVPGVQGDLWIELNHVLVLQGVFGGFSGFQEFALPRGLTLVVQAVALQGGSVELSTPAVVQTRP